MRITTIEVLNDTFIRVTTDEGMVGHGFQRLAAHVVEDVVRPALVGKDPFAIERLLQIGLLKWLGVEHALWDIVGKSAGLPVYKLLGGDKERIKVYLTCVWEGDADQSHITPEQQAEQAVAYLEKGYKAMKIRAWRLDPMADVAAVKAIKDAVGDRMDVMADRTAQYPGSVWDYGTAYRVARELEDLGASWLEEPFHRGDVVESARLAEIVKLPITGGEGDKGLKKFLKKQILRLRAAARCGQAEIARFRANERILQRFNAILRDFDLIS